MTAKLSDSYQWWVGKRVDVRVGASAWVLAEVTEAERTTLIDTSTGVDRPFFYEAEAGESDGNMQVVLLEGTARGSLESVEMFPGGPCGIVPNVVIHMDFSERLRTWWTHLSVSAKAQLSLDPDGPVPHEVLPELTKTGPLTFGTYWPGHQAGPDGFRLPYEHVAFILDQKLQRQYVRAQDALDTAVKATGGPLTACIWTPEVRAKYDTRDAAKTQWDTHRLTLV